VPPFLTLERDAEWSASLLKRLTLGEYDSSVPYFTRGLVGRRAGLEVIKQRKITCRKPNPKPIPVPTELLQFGSCRQVRVCPRAGSGEYAGRYRSIASVQVVVAEALEFNNEPGHVSAIKICIST
jgi:hypothetical protein